MTLYEPGTRLSPNQRRPGEVVLPGALVTYEHYYRYKKFTHEHYNAWTSYTPGTTQLSIYNPAPFPIQYNIQLRVDVIYLGTVLKREITDKTFLVHPTPALRITNFNVSPSPFQAGTVNVTFDAYFVPGSDTDVSLFGEIWLYDNLGVEQFYDFISGGELTNIGGDTYQHTFTAPVWYEEPSVYGDLVIEITGNPSGTLIPTVVQSHTFTDVWESQAVPAYVCFNMGSIDGTSFNSDSYTESGDVSYVAPAGLNTGAVTVSFDWVQDSYPEESDLYLISPTGTQINLGSYGFDANTDGSYEISITDFSGETSEGEWIFKETDSFGDGGGDVNNIVICFGVLIEPSAIPSGETFGTPTLLVDIDGGVIPESQTATVDGGSIPGSQTNTIDGGAI